MATSTESTVVYAAGVVQGVALVTFPAAGAILTDPAEYDLTSSQYGLLFVPQVVTAITAALLGASLSERFGTKRVLIAGLVRIELAAGNVTSATPCSKAAPYTAPTSRRVAMGGSHEVG